MAFDPLSETFSVQGATPQKLFSFNLELIVTYSQFCQFPFKKWIKNESLTFAELNAYIKTNVCSSFETYYFLA